MKIGSGTYVYHNKRKCKGLVLYEVTSDSSEYRTGRLKMGRQWKVLWTRHDDTTRHTELMSVHMERNLSPL